MQKFSSFQKAIESNVFTFLLFFVMLVTLAHQAFADFAYVANNGTNTVSVINTATNTVVATITVGTSPAEVAITPNGNFAYVTNTGSDTVSVIRTSDNTVIATIPVATFPAGIAITPNGNFAYVTIAKVAGEVSVINT